MEVEEISEFSQFLDSVNATDVNPPRHPFAVLKKLYCLERIVGAVFPKLVCREPPYVEDRMTLSIEGAVEGGQIFSGWQTRPL